MSKPYDLQQISEDLATLQNMPAGDDREQLLSKVLPVLYELVTVMSKIAEKIGEPVDEDVILTGRRPVAKDSVN